MNILEFTRAHPNQPHLQKEVLGNQRRPCPIETQFLLKALDLQFYMVDVVFIPVLISVRRMDVACLIVGDMFRL